MAPQAWPDRTLAGVRDVHLFWCRVDPDAPVDDGCLSADERDRGARFFHERDRVRHRVRNAFLREVLGHYLDLPPAALAFRTGAHGKPELDHPAAGGWSFNLSHSEDRILVALARGGPDAAPRDLGVDVEARRPMTEVGRMSRQVFTVRERALLDGLNDEDERLAAFFRGWTRKEAALKATGEGFAREPRTVEVGLDERPPGAPWQVPNEPLLAGYSLSDLDAPDGFSACLCAAGDDWRPVIVSRAT